MKFPFQVKKALLMINKAVLRIKFELSTGRSNELMNSNTFRSYGLNITFISKSAFSSLSQSFFRIFLGVFLCNCHFVV